MLQKAKTKTPRRPVSPPLSHKRKRGRIFLVAPRRVQSTNFRFSFFPSESKQAVPLLDYVHNVVSRATKKNPFAEPMLVSCFAMFCQMKFIQAIVSNNATDDHCQEFQSHGGLPILFQLLHLRALPMDFPASPACQSVANLVKSILVSGLHASRSRTRNTSCFLLRPYSDCWFSTSLAWMPVTFRN